MHISQPQGSSHILEAQITALKVKSQPWGSNHSPKAQIPLLMLKFKLDTQNLLSIGHRPLRGRCPSHHHTSTYTHIGATGTADHLTLLRLLSPHELRQIKKTLSRQEKFKTPLFRQRNKMMVFGSFSFLCLYLFHVLVKSLPLVSSFFIVFCHCFHVLRPKNNPHSHVGVSALFNGSR